MHNTSCLIVAFSAYISCLIHRRFAIWGCPSNISHAAQIECECTWSMNNMNEMKKKRDWQITAPRWPFIDVHSICDAFVWARISQASPSWPILDSMWWRSTWFNDRHSNRWPFEFRWMNLDAFRANNLSPWLWLASKCNPNRFRMIFVMIFACKEFWWIFTCIFRIAQRWTQSLLTPMSRSSLELQAFTAALATSRIHKKIRNSQRMWVYTNSAPEQSKESIVYRFERQFLDAQHFHETKRQIRNFQQFSIFQLNPFGHVQTWVPSLPNWDNSKTHHSVRLSLPLAPTMIWN